ncbi:unnamed protein product [Auanema sp. JU1783]|nr:unnamed protein product [Auanema sp. JU1783]
MANSVDLPEATPRLIPINVSKTIFVTYPAPPLIVDWVNKKITQPGSLLNKNTPEDPADSMSKNKTDVKTRSSSRSANVKSKKASTSDECFERTFIIEQDKSTKTANINGRKKIISTTHHHQYFRSKEKSCVRKNPSKAATSCKEETSQITNKSKRQVTKVKTTSTSESTNLSKNKSQTDTVKTTRRTVNRKTCAPISSTFEIVPLEDNTEKEVVRLTSRRTSKMKPSLSNTRDRTVVSEKESKENKVVNSTRRGSRMKTCLPAFPSRVVVSLKNHDNGKTISSTGFRSCALDKSCKTVSLNRNTSVDNSVKPNRRAPRMKTCVPTLPSRTIIPLKGSEDCKTKPNSVAPRMRSCVASEPSGVAIQNEDGSRKANLKSNRMKTCVPVTPSRILVPNDIKHGSKYKNVVPRMKTCIPSMSARVVIPLKDEAKNNHQLNRGSLRMKSCIPNGKDRIVLPHGTQRKPN